MSYTSLKDEKSSNFRFCSRQEALLCDTPLTHSRFEQVKCVLFSLTLIPAAKFILFIFGVLSTTLVVSLAVIGFKHKDESGHAVPLPKWRRRWISIVGRAFNRAGMFINGFYWLQVKGKPDPCAPIMVANHCAQADGNLLYHLAPFSVMIKISQRPFFPPIMDRVLATIWIDPHSKESRSAAVAELKHRASRASEFGLPLLLFPEGENNNQSALLPFRKGAFLFGLPVQPVAIRYPYTFCNPAFLEQSPLSLLYRCCCQFFQRAEFEFLPLYKPSPEEKANPELYAENVRRAIAQRLDCALVRRPGIDDVGLHGYQAQAVALDLHGENHS